MSKIDELRSLVEEVRNIVNADAATEDAEAREAVYQEAADEIADEIFEVSAADHKAFDHGDASGAAAHVGRSKGRAAARDDEGKPKHLPWEDWRDGDDEHTSGWMRATSPSGDATFEGEVGWSNELGHGTRAPEPKQAERDVSVRVVER